MSKESNERRSVIGPQLPFDRKPDSDDEDDSDSDTYGPALPPPTTETEVGEQREEWMTSAPSAITGSVGLNEAPAKIKKPEDEAYRKAMAERDAMLLEAVEEYNREKRPFSLVEMHQSRNKKSKTQNDSKEKSSESKPKGKDKEFERRPLEFDPEQDLKVRRLDRSQTAAIVNSSKFLDSRFAAGSQRFL